MRTGRRDLKSHNFKKRKSIFSFGDIVLPFVGILAVGMLLFAAKLFFFDGFPASSGMSASVTSVPSVPRIKSGAEDNNPLFPAAGEASAEEAEKTENNENAENGENKSEFFESANENLNKNSEKNDGTQTQLTVTTTHVNNEANNTRREPVKIKAQQTPTQKNKVSEPKKPVKPAVSEKQAKQAKKSDNPAQWRVQVGAYGSKKAADEIIAKLAKAGYTATSYAVSKYHKVWVQAGNTKQAAEEVAKKLRKIGYPGSYVIPPPSRN